MSQELYNDTDAAGRQIIIVDPINPTSGETYTLELFDVQISFVATASTDANIVNGWKAAILASVAPEWADVVPTIDETGDRLILTYGGANGTVRLWRGDAPAVAQVTTITPVDVTAGDIFSVTINGKVLSYVATESTADNVVEGLLALVSATDVPEFSDFDAVDTGTALTLTAANAGIPFEVSSAASSGDGAALVTQTQEAVAGEKTSQSVIIPDSFAPYRIRFGGDETVELAHTDDESDVQTAVDNMGTMTNAVVTIVDNSTYRSLTIDFDNATDEVFRLWGDASGLNFADVVSSGSDWRLTIPEMLTAGSVTVEDEATFVITIDGFTSEPIQATSGSLAADIETALNGMANIHGVTVNDVSTALKDITFPAATGTPPAIVATWAVEPADGAIPVTVDTDGTPSANTTYLVSVIGDAGTFTLTADAETTAGIAFDASISTVETALEALSSVDAATVTGTPGNYSIEFVGSLAATQVDLTSTATGLTGSGTESLTVTTTVPSSGPNHWDDEKNWTPAGVPITGDAVRFEFGGVDCLYGLDQSAVLLASFHVGLAYGGSIGLPRTNGNGFFEYRVRDLTIGATDILIGYGDGGGSGKIQIDTGSDRTTIEVRETGGSSESGIPAFTWRGSNTLNAVNVLSGEFGSALYADQASRIDIYTQRGGSASLANCVLNEIDAPGQTLRAHNCTLGDNGIEL